MVRPSMLRGGMVLVVVLASTSSHGQELTLDYDAPSGCPTRDTFRQFIAARLGVDPVGQPHATKVSVRVTGTGPFSATMGFDTVGRPLRQRTFTGASCGELVQSVAVALAVVLDPLVRRDQPPAPAPPETVEPPPVELPARVEQPAPEPPPAPAPPVPAPVALPQPAPAAKLSLALGGGATAGLTPAIASPLLRAEARLQWKMMSIGLEASGLVPTTGIVQAVLVTTAGISGSLVPCAHWRWLSGCGTVTAGGLHISGAGLPQARGGWAGYLSLGARVALTASLSEALGLVVFGELAAPLTRIWASVVVPAGLNRLWSTSPVVGGLGLLVMYTL